MTSRIRNPKDFWAGIIYIAFGLSAIVIGREYGLGTALRMGPAYFPTVLGGLLTLIGAISVIRSFLTPGEPVGSLAFKPMLFIVVASVGCHSTARHRHDGVLCNCASHPRRLRRSRSSLDRPIMFRSWCSV